jgi:hypothetical protein
MHGHGIFYMGDGSTYEGEFYEGEIQGIGLRRWPDGTTYSGQFVKGEMYGEGVYLSAKGEKYEGEFRDNKRWGKGELTHANHDFYQGDFVAHKPNGHGKMVYASNGNSYEGGWQDGLSHGIGILFDAQKKKIYEGEWENGQREGLGIGLIDSNNDIYYQGYWRANEPMSYTQKFSFTIAKQRQVMEPNATSKVEKGADHEEVLVSPGEVLQVKKSDKLFPPIVIQSLFVDSTENAQSVVVGEFGRKLRLRIFEGEKPVVVAGIEGDTQSQTPSSQWQLARQQQDGDNEEIRLDEVISVNQNGCAHFDSLALPSNSHLGAYHLLCDFVSTKQEEENPQTSSSSIPPAYLTLVLVD